MSKGYTRINVDDVQDVAPDYGMGDATESRLLTKPLDGEGIGASFYRLKPGKRFGFGHSHEKAEEMYLVMEGGGRAKIDDDILDLAHLDAIRCAPEAVREFEGGPDGMVLLAFGHRIPGDGAMDKDFWPQADVTAA